MTFVGLDLHKRYITACALDATGGVIGEVRRMAVSLASLGDFLGMLAGPVTVGMEATLYWQWLHDRLEALGHGVRVADARQVKLIWQARSKTDPIDARKLAELLRVNLFPSVWIPDADTRRRRQLLHGRAFIVRQRTQIKNRLHGRLTAENLLFPRSDLYGRAGRAWLATTPLSPTLRSQVDRLLRLHDVLTVEIDQLDDEVKRLRRDHPMIEQLHTIPGVGLFGALFLVAEIGTIERFGSSHQLTAYAGLVPSTRSSGGKTTHGRVGHASNRWLKWILVEIVQTLKRSPGPVGDQYRRLLRAKGKPKATTAAARKLCCYIYWMWKEGLSYEEWLGRRGQVVWSEVRPVQRMGAVA
ncbi:MAG: IS110 family transposase [Gemmatimonadaceae bacterium]